MSEEFGAVTFGKGGKVIPLGGTEGDTFEFPDEIAAREEVQKEAKAAPEVDIEIVDDTPPEDRGREPMEADAAAIDD